MRTTLRSALVSAMVILVLPAVLGTGTAASAAPPAERNTAQTATATIAIEGMACSVCAAKVTAALKKLDGVKDAKVSHKNNEAVVQYDPAQVTLEKLVRVIREAGFKATLPGQSSTEMLRVSPTSRRRP